MTIITIPGTTAPAPNAALGRIPIWLPPVTTGLVGCFLTAASADQARYNNAVNVDGNVIEAPRFTAGFIAGDDALGDPNAGAIETNVTQTVDATWIAIVKSLDIGAGAATRPQWISNRRAGADSNGMRIQEADDGSRTIEAVVAMIDATRTVTLAALDPTVWRCIAVRLDATNDVFTIYSLSPSGGAAVIDAQASSSITGLTVDPAAATLRLLNNANNPPNAGKGAIANAILHNVCLSEADMLRNAAVSLKAAAALGVTVGA